MTISADLKHTVLPGQLPPAVLTVDTINRLKKLGWPMNQIREFDQGEVDAILRHRQINIYGGETDEITTTWITKRCPRCGREYRFPAGVRDPGCCMNTDCQWRHLHPEVKRERRALQTH